MSDNTNLHRANKSKEDEFYTQISDIENELKHYKKEFRDKIIFCNCDDPYESNFFKYFAMNFNVFGLKKLIATCYAGSPVATTQLCFSGFEDEIRAGKKAYKIEITEVADYNKDGAVDLTDVEHLLKSNKNTYTMLKGDGDFRSDECTELLKEADVVVTNPPFSLFREYVAQLIENDKKFIIIGNRNALTYKEIFPLIKDNKMWLGYGFNGGNAYFSVPNKVSYANGVYDEKTGLVKFRNCCWYTNVDTTKRHQDILLYKFYNEEEYPKYDNYDAVNVDKVSDIPCDYEGVMGVPITFMDKYNPDQFVILGMAASAGYNLEVVGIPFKGEKDARPLINGKNTYARVFIKKKR